MHYFPAVPLESNKIIDNVALLSPYYELKFDLKPYGIVHGWSSVLHVTTGNDVTAYGDRAPAVFFHSLTTKMLVCTALSGNKNYCVTFKPLDVHKYAKIRIVQHVISGKLLFQVHINGKLEHSIENKDARFFKNVRVYSGDKWYTPANADVTNYSLQNTASRKYDKYITVCELRSGFG